MQSYHAQSGSGIEGLVLEEHPVPSPRRGEVLVRVRASSLNFRELSVLRGTYPLPVKANVIMGADGAGEVVAVGEDVTRVAPGARVAGAMFPHWLDGPFVWETAGQLGGSLDGMLTEYIALDAEGVVEIPDHLSFEEAATLPCAAVTAWNALMGSRPLRAGETVLTLGSGGVSLFALQLAKVLGARVIATTSSDAKAARLRELGADTVINYVTHPDWPAAVRELTRGKGVERVIDVSGTLEQSIRATAFEGEVAFIGRLDTATTLDIGVLYRAIATVRVIPAGSRAHFQALNRAIEATRLRPVIDRVFPFSEVPAALRYFEGERPFGKVVVRIP